MLPGIAGIMAGLGGAAGPGGLSAFIAVAGQSNARSYDTTGSDVPVALQGAMTGVNIWRPSAGAFETYEAGVNSDIWTSGAGTPQKWGPEAAFALAFRTAFPTTTLYMVKIAVDSSALAAGVGDDWSPTSSGELYDDMEAELTAAKAVLSGLGHSTDLDAVLWMQGEADALTSTPAINYGVNLTAFVAALRADWGVAGTKLIVGRITPSAEWPSGSPVRAWQARVGADESDVPVVDTDSYTLAADDKHYVAASVQTLGEDMYDAFAGTYPPIPVRYGYAPDDKSADVTLSNGDLTAAGTGVNSSALQTVRCDHFSAGKVYLEFLIDARAANLSCGMGKGVATGQFWGQLNDSIGYVSATGAVFKNNVQILTYATYTAGDRVMIAFDGATGEVWFGKNGTWNGDPAAGTGEAATLSTDTTTSRHRYGNTLRRSGDQVTLKLAAADFAYTPPTGFDPV